MKTETAKAKINNGGFLMSEYDPDDGKLKYRVIPGGRVTPNQARTLIEDLDLEAQKDSLFADCPSQTWRKGA